MHSGDTLVASIIYRCFVHLLESKPDVCIKVNTFSFMKYINNLLFHYFCDIIILCNFFQFMEKTKANPLKS